MDERLSSLPRPFPMSSGELMPCSLPPARSSDAEIVMAEALGKQAETIATQADMIVSMARTNQELVAKLNV